MMRSLSYIFLFSVLSITVSTAQVSFTASSDAKQIVEGSTVNITFSLKNAEGSGFKPPSINGLEVIAGPSTQRKMSSVNGRTTSSVGYTYTLLGQKVGTYKIGAASIKANGKVMKSQPITIQVLKGTAANQIKDKKNYVAIEVSDSTAVIGQQIVLEYVLYFQQDLSGYDIVKEDEYDGFFSQSIRSEDRSTNRVIINGEEFHRKSLESVTLFPQRTGVFEIDAAQVTLAFPIPGQKRRGFFSSAPTRKKQIRTNKMKIYVEELPKPVPSYFSGAVGKYRMQATIAKKSVTTDDAILMNMEIRGNGDGKTVKAPVQPPMDNMEYYDPNIIEDKDLKEEGNIDNYKKIEYLIVPQKAGNVIIRPEFTYYDTDSNKYETIRANPIRVNVKQGSRTITKDDREIAVGQQMSPPRIETDTVSKGLLKYWDVTLYGSFGLFFLALLGIYWKKRQIDIEDGIDPVEKRKRAALKLATDQLSKAKGFMESKDQRGFYSEVSNAMNGFLGDKYQIPNSDFSKAQITEHLQSNGVDESYTNRYLDILKKCEMAIFAGQSESNMALVYEESLSLIKDLATET